MILMNKLSNNRNASLGEQMFEILKFKQALPMLPKNLGEKVKRFLVTIE